MIVVVFVVLYTLFLRRMTIDLDGSLIQEQRSKLGKMDRDEIVVALVQALQIVLFFIRPYAFKVRPGVSNRGRPHLTPVLTLANPPAPLTATAHPESSGCLACFE